MSYYIGSKIKEKAPHHESFKDLWETKWKKPCSMSVYPFMFGKVEDFEPVVSKLIEMDMHEPYDWDEYARAFFPSAAAVVVKAQEAESSGDRKQASDFLADIPMQEVQIPHPHAVYDEAKTFPVYVQVPAAASKESPAPCIIIFTGLDGYRTELALWRNIFIPRGCGLIIVEIPGTGDSPALKQDPKSPDRQWSSLLDWTETQASIDHNKLVVWGFSTGGYYSIRVAHTHADRLKGAVSLGGGCHHMFDPEWLGEVDHLEYPFDLAGALAYKFGYPDLESFKKDARAKFSLLENGILDMPCTRLLLVNVS
ncbi:hypothetical protein GP486_003094 [Trichoglossum hirsutum]|uniref:Alpha/beta-hydrolase n=1 Tax=Trichoglossum hirsutum TaxID=265104 RepID=A0A9P8RR29_9PEZI|nr:hypothetical protein GP486_003094 [Trichoglossum hirsutum]